MSEIAVRFVDVLPPPPRDLWPGPVSFEVDAGSFTLFATTPGIALHLIRLLAGLRESAAGRVDVLGVDPGRLDRWTTQRFRRRLGVGFDEPSGLVSNLTLRLNLVVPMVYSGLADMATAQARATDMIRACGLERWANTRPADLPPEVRREAVIARAAVRKPDLLVLEEPTNGLSDARARRLLTLARERAGTLIVTTAEREGLQFTLADVVITLEHAATEAPSHEVGVI